MIIKWFILHLWTALHIQQLIFVIYQWPSSIYVSSFLFQITTKKFLWCPVWCEFGRTKCTPLLFRHMSRYKYSKTGILWHSNSFKKSIPMCSDYKDPSNKVTTQKTKIFTLSSKATRCQYAKGQTNVWSYILLHKCMLRLPVICFLFIPAGADGKKFSINLKERDIFVRSLIRHKWNKC